jgi:hypothetical protein
MDIEKTFNLRALQPNTLNMGIDISDELESAALAIERVLSAAYERGSVDAVVILSTVSGLLRDVLRHRARAEGRVSERSGAAILDQ